MMLTKIDRIRGGMHGLLVGDAAGVPYEFKSPMAIPAFKEIEMIPPQGFRRTWDNIPSGTWSDDGSQALILLEVLLDNETSDFPRDKFIANLIRWMQTGYMAVDNNRFDIGMQTQRALMDHACGLKSTEEASVRSNGNGSLMRQLPVALMPNRDNVVTFSYDQSDVTHPHIISQMCCVLYAHLTHLLLDGMDKNDAVDEVIGRFESNRDTLKLAATGMERSHVAKPTLISARAEYMVSAIDVILKAESNECTGSGYVVDSLWTAITCLRRGNNYEQVIKHAISYGNDTDTTACIAGGLAGVYYGYESIPQRWLNEMRGMELAAPLIDRLVALHAEDAK